MIAILKKYNCRIIYNENEEWFHAGDIGNILELSNIRKVLPKIDSEYKCKFKDSDVTKGYNQNFKTKLNNRGELFLKPHAVYNVAFRSNKEEAREFTKWVTNVIELIRKNGYYIATEKDEKWLGIRQESKKERKKFTDEIQEFVYYATKQGSGKPEMYYKHFTKLVNDKLKIDKNLKRDDLSQDTLSDIMAFERIIAIKISKLITEETSYKEVYKKIKELISNI